MRFAILLAVYLGFTFLGTAYYAYQEFSRELPDDLRRMEAPPSRATQVFSSDGELIGEFFVEKRKEVPLRDIPLVVQQAFISAEDSRFWQHPGFDFFGIVRAAWSNYRGLGTRQGASTITQQVTRMLMLSNERTYSRKIKELILAARVERQLSKRKILELYLNRVYLGHGAYGVHSAASVYFGKNLADVEPGEAALLAGLTQAPSAYSPHRNLRAARMRQHYVLGRMRDDGYLTAADAQTAADGPITLVDPDRPLNLVAAPYFVEHVRQWAEREYGHRKVLRAGLRIYTTVDMRAQRRAEAAVKSGLAELDKKIGFRGPLSRLGDRERQAFTDGPPRPYRPGREAAVLAVDAPILPGVSYLGVVTGIHRKGIEIDAGPQTLPMLANDTDAMKKWRDPNDRSTIRVGDVIPVRLAANHKGETVFTLAQVPDVEGALVSIEPRTGRVISLIGGYSFTRSRFNRAIQARRQIGSAMKPFIYLTALMNGRTQMDVVVDAPVKVRTVGGIWAPKNYDGQYRGRMTLRTALAKSINTVSVRLVLQVGIDAIIDLMRQLGIRTRFSHHVSMALGTPDLSLIEVTSAIGAFAAGGQRVIPRFVDRVITADGRSLLDAESFPPSPQIIPASYAYLMADMMKAVVARGTGRRALALGRPAAGKTGTSTGHRDAWFIGFTRDLVSGVWVGRDDFTPIGAKATGGSTALPIWLQFMSVAHPPTEPRDFDVPDDIVFVRANQITGAPSPPGQGAKWIPFVSGTVPPRFQADRRLLPFERSPSPRSPDVR